MNASARRSSMTMSTLSIEEVLLTVPQGFELRLEEIQ